MIRASKLTKSTQNTPHTVTRNASRAKGPAIRPARPTEASQNPLASRTPPATAKAQKYSTAMLIAAGGLAGTIAYGVGMIQGTLKEAKVHALPTNRAPTQKDFDAALKQVKRVLPAECVSEEKHDLSTHGIGEWNYQHPTVLPGAIIYPRSTEDVVKIINIASANSIPIIPFSGGTSLEGHFFAPKYKSKTGNDVEVEAKTAVADIKPGLAFTLDFAENMNAIIKVNAHDLDVVVQPGITYDALNESLKEHGLYFPVDPGPGAMIGGMIGTGCSGTNAIRYGTMRENVLNLTAVLPNGEVVKTRQRAKKCSAGPDLGRLFIGSEGTLGIITEATLKLVPLLPYSVGVTSFPTVEAAADCVRDVVQEGIVVQCIELLDDVMIKAVNQQSASDPSVRKWPEKPALFIKFQGSDDQIKLDLARTANIVKKYQGTNLQFAKSQKEKEELWHARKVALWSALDYVPGSKCIVTDVCVPISRFPELMRQVKEDVETAGIVGPLVGHAGDGNLHALLLFKDEQEKAKAKEVVHKMVEFAQQLGGTCTGEHGVGLGKKNYLEAELGRPTIDLLRNIKGMMDPQNLFNPGKLYPDAV